MSSAAKSADSKDAFCLDEVSVRFDEVEALDRVSLRIAQGEKVGFVGPSGAGKTTLLRLLNASQSASSGTVSLLGRPLTERRGDDLRRVRSAIGFVPQGFHLIHSLRVIHNVLMGRLGRQGFWASARSLLRPSKAEQVAVLEVLQRVGLEEKLFAKADNLSGGQQQRVAIARALYQSPEALLADEPVASVDPSRARATMDLLTRLADEAKLTLAVSLHDQDLARAFLPRLVGVRDGKIFKDAPTESWKAEDFEALYRLSDEQILQDGGVH